MAATAQVVYGQVLWNPLTIVLLWDNRTAKFFAGLLFAFATIATSETKTPSCHNCAVNSLTLSRYHGQ